MTHHPPTVASCQRQARDQQTQPNPYDDPFYSFNLLQYGPQEPISVVRQLPSNSTVSPENQSDSAVPATLATGDPNECMDASRSIGSGRPTKLDPAKQEAFCTLVRAGCSRSVAARLLGVNRRTIWYTAHNDPAFKEQILDAQRQAEALAYTNIARAGGKSWRASAWLVERRKPQRERARAPSVRAVLRNREFQAELKKLVKQLLPASNTKPRLPKSKTQKPKARSKKQRAHRNHQELAAERAIWMKQIDNMFADH
jgi:hypothetical protein